jgi:predicted Rossmann-fold nucleotide-binding protein
MSAVSQTGPTVAVFASDKGPGDPERSSLMSEFGRVFGRKGARIICLAEDGAIPVPLVTAARMAGGSVEVLADSSIVLPPALAEVPITVLPDDAERRAQLAAMASVLVGLPGSLTSVKALFGAWASATGLPVVLLNRHKAFDAIRGFAADVMTPGLPGHERRIQFADTVDDLWNRVVSLTERR